MESVDNILYHVRAAPPTSSRTLRFRNKFQHKSCLFATADRHDSVQDWFSRYITGTCPDILSIDWGVDTVTFHVTPRLTNETYWLGILNDIRTYVYQYTLDLHWNRHPTKNCYMTRSNVKYRAHPTAITFKEIVGLRRIDITTGADNANR